MDIWAAVCTLGALHTESSQAQLALKLCCAAGSLVTDELMDRCNRCCAGADRLHAWQGHHSWQG